MGWKQFLREVERSQRRSERAALQRHRQLVRESVRLDKINTKLAEQKAAQAEVSEFESYLDVLVSLHKDCGENWDWQSIAAAPQPSKPSPSSSHQDQARSALEGYRPGFFDKLLKRDRKRIAEYERRIVEAEKQDSDAYEESLSAYRKDLLNWDLRRKMAAGVLKRDPEAYQRVLQMASPFEEVLEFKTRVVIDHVDADVIAITCILEDEELVPTEELSLTKAGKVSRKNMPAGRYWTLHQDYVCSCALRVARETLALLPVTRVIVNVGANRIDSSTGHSGTATILAVHFTRGALQSLNVASIDPSDSLKNFNCRMKFKKTTGFEPVDPITPEEQWISA